MIPRVLLVAAGALAIPASAIGGPALAQALAPAQVIAEGSVVRSEVVAIGRGLVIRGEALRDVAVVSGSIDVSGRVGGDVIVLGGEARLTSAARVGGDVFVLGGGLVAEAGAVVDGRSVAYPTVSAAWLTLLEGPSLGLPALSPVVVGAKLAVLSAWMAVVLLLFATAGREVLSTSRAVLEQPFSSFAVGLTGVFAMVLTALLFSTFAAALVGLPLLVLVVVLALLLKIWGLTALFHALGDWLGRKLLRRRLQPLNAAVLGLLVLGAIKLVPWTGTWFWTAATFIGVGAALTTKFGRRSPWFGGVEVGGLATGGAP